MLSVDIGLAPVKLYACTSFLRLSMLATHNSLSNQNRAHVLGHDKYGAGGLSRDATSKAHGAPGRAARGGIWCGGRGVGGGK